MSYVDLFDSVAIGEGVKARDMSREMQMRADRALPYAGGAFRRC